MGSKKYFVALLSSYINETEPPEFDGQNVDWDLVFYLAKIHSVQVAVYLAISKLQIKPPNFEDFKAQFNMCVNVSAKQQYWMQKVIKAFTENNIKHTLVKGYVLKDYYKNSEARSFGDVDILISEEDRQKSDDVIKSLGFKFDKDHYNREVWTYSNGALSLEIHTKLIYEKLFNDFDYQEYFVKKSENVELIQKCTYQLRLEDHFLYLLVHLAKHFYNYGVGIRMLMDIAVYLKECGENMYFYYIKTELENLKLLEFTCFMFDLCSDFFDINIDFCEKNETDFNENKTAVVEYIINHGVFGFENKNPYYSLYYRDNSNRFNMLIEKAFPCYERMTELNSWFEGKPKFLLPYGWARHWFECIFNKNKNLKMKMSAILTDDSEIKKHTEMLKIVGLK